MIVVKLYGLLYGFKEISSVLYLPKYVSSHYKDDSNAQNCAPINHKENYDTRSTLELKSRFSERDSFSSEI